MSTKSKIINASIKNFLILGYEKTSLSKISSDVGIKKPSIYYHFKNKEELFITSIEYLIESMEYRISFSIKDLNTARDMLSSIFNTLVEFNEDLSDVIGSEYYSHTNIFNFLHHEIKEFPSLNRKRNLYYANLKNTIMEIIKIGQKNKEIRKDLNSELVSIEVIAWIEGLFMLNSIYTPLSISSLRQDFFNNLWRILSIESNYKKTFFGGRSTPKTISLGTKW